MRFPSVPVRFFASAVSLRAPAAAATVTVCLSTLLASNAAGAPAPGSVGFRPVASSLWDAEKSVVYVSVPSSNEIQVYDQASNLSAPIGTITDQLFEPGGLFVDQKQELYVANFGRKYTGYVLVFARGSAKAKSRIEVPAMYGAPTQVFVDHAQTLYVVGCFEQGCDIAKRTSDGTWSNITDSDVALPEGIVGDGQGDLYVSGYSYTQNGAIVEELPKGRSAWRGIGFPYFASAGQVAFDLLGRLTIADGALDVYSFFTSLSQLDDAFRCLNCSSIAFDASGADVWGLGDTEPPSLAEYQFPGGAPEKSVQLKVSGAAAIAVSPALAAPTPPPPAEALQMQRARYRAVRHGLHGPGSFQLTS